MIIGILILLVTIVIVGIVHIFSMKTIKISESKKSHYRKSFWYLYGIILLLSGGTNLVAKGDFYWSFSIKFLLGLLIIILNFLNKIESRTK